MTDAELTTYLKELEKTAQEDGKYYTGSTDWVERLTTGMMPVVRCSVFLRRRRLIRGGTETM